MASSLSIFFTLALAGLVAVPAFGQTLVDTDPSVELEMPQLQVEENVLSLSLEDAVELALRRNLNLIAQRYDLSRAAEAIRANLGIYDLTTNASYFFGDQESLAGSELDGADVVQSERQTFNFDLSQLTPYGGTASFNYTSRRDASNSTFLTFNPQYPVTLNLSFVQPLLRNRGKLPTNRSLILARTDQLIGLETFRGQVIDTVERVEEAYWRLVQARKQLQVSQESLALAQELHERNQVKVEVGTLAPFELVQSEAGIARRESEIIRNEAEVGDAADNLRRLLNLPEGDLWLLDIEPETEPGMDPVAVDLSAALRTALEERTELRSKAYEIDRLEVNSEYFKNQKKPRLDLTLGYGSNATDGVVTDPRTGEILRDNDIFDSLSSAISRDFDGWTAQLNFGFPIQNRTAKANSAIANINLDKGRQELTDLEQQITTEVRSTVRQLQAASQQVRANRAERVAQEKSLEAERKRFENGMSTSFQVLEIQEDLSNAQSAEVQAVTNYRIQLAAYNRAIGKLLEVSGITIDEDTGP
jgi:outer membrane protein TolC